MRIQALQYFLVVLLFIAVSAEVKAQVSGYNPFFVTNSRENTYSPNQGLLRLPIVSVFPSENGPEFLYNVVLQHQQGNSFELVSVDELLPEQECTRAEVNEAIPQLEFGMTVAEAEALIGCTANLQIGRTDLETGREVLATWAGRDGVANNPNRSLIGGAPVWIGGSSGGVFRTVYSNNTGSPSIILSLRENVPESISYSNIDQVVFCYSEDMLARFRQVNLDDEYPALVTILDCEGNLQGVSFDETNLQQEYSWVAPPGSQNTVPPSSDVESQRLSESMQVTVFNSRVQSFNYHSRNQTSFNTACTVDDLIAAHSQVQIGQATSGLAELLSCGVLSETISGTASAERVTYSWRTSIPNESLFLTSNRELSVIATDGVVNFVRLNRF